MSYRTIAKSAAIMLFTLSGILPTQAAPYSPAQTNRVDLNFNTSWKFYRGDATGADAAAFNDATWEKVCLPHTVRVEPRQCSGNKNYQGIAWYRRHFYVDNAYQGRKIFIEFEGAMQVADVWVNGTKLITHMGGYTPFTVDATTAIKYGGSTDNVIAVRVNNSDNSNMAPGQPQINLDFCYFGGLYRNVYMHITDKLHVTDAVYANKATGGIYVTYSNVSTSSAQVTIRTNVLNENSASKTCMVTSAIVDANNQVVAEKSDNLPVAGAKDTTFSQTVTVANPNLWQPDHPYLYTLYTTVFDGTIPVDFYKTRIGIRWIEFGDFGLKINGQIFKAGGCNRHQEYVYIGNALPNSLHRRDAIKMREASWISVRCAHYPQSPAFMDACDEMGIVVIACAPGWQYFYGTAFEANAQQSVRDMVRWQRNHPCIILWEPLLNEANYSDDYSRLIYTAVHSELPGNQTFCSCDKTMNSGQSVPSASLYEVQYGGTGTTGAGWRRETGDDWTEQNDVNKHGFRCHRGANGALNGFYYGGEAAMLNRASKVFSSYTSGFGAATTAGWGLWSGFDYNRGFSPHLCATGAMDPYRLPKFDYYEFMMQRDPNLAIPGTQMGPMVFIANYWTSTSPRNVEVYSNCEQVKLYVNGALIGTQSPTVTTYRAKVVFSNVPWQAGELKAEGLIGGVVKATYSVGTPGSADHIDLAADKCGMELVADGSDIMPVYAYVKDGNNTVMPVDSSLITFTVSGPAKIIGDGDTRVGANPVKAEAGIIGVLIQSTRTAGTITVTATSGSMKQGTVTFQSVPLADLVVTGPDQPAAGVLPQSPRPYSLPVLSRQNKDIAMIIDCAGRMLPRSIAAKAQSAAVYDLTGKLLFKTISGNASVPVNRGPGAVNRACVVRTKTMP